MQLIEKQKAISTQRQSRHFSVEVPINLSREKVFKYAQTQSEVRGTQVNPIPHGTARSALYLMFMKIGATNELPEEKSLQESWLNDFWQSIYLNNHICPGDIPFDLMIREFTLALVQGTVDRYGNNQAAIVQSFNRWVRQDHVRHMLYEKRNSEYPHAQPKQIPVKATEHTIQDYSDEDLEKKLRTLQPLKGIRLVDQMIAEINKEIERRAQ